LLSPAPKTSTTNNTKQSRGSYDVVVLWGCWLPNDGISDRRIRLVEIRDNSQDRLGWLDKSGPARSGTGETTFKGSVTDFSHAIGELRVKELAG
jgi:hypothetical protein